MTIGIIATIAVKEGKNSEFETVFSELTKQVLANEKGCLLYALHRSKQDPQTYKVFEQYASNEDVKQHAKTEYFQAANAKLALLVTAAPDIEVLDAV